MCWYALHNDVIYYIYVHFIGLRASIVSTLNLRFIVLLLCHIIDYVYRLLDAESDEEYNSQL
jgi:hypothetical protein